MVAQEPVQAVSTPYTPPVYNSGVEQWRSLVASIMPAETIDRWLRVMACESGGRADAVGAAGELGLLQIHPRYHWDATTDPEGNVRAAYRISGGGYDFGPWSCKGW